jgi:hypothetical protein
MCFIPRISGPATGFLKMASLAMKRMSRSWSCAGIPAKVKSRWPVWLIATTAPPRAGNFSEPVTVKRSPARANMALAATITGG